MVSPQKKMGSPEAPAVARPFLKGIFERDRRLPPSLRTSPPRDFESSGLVEAERHVTAGGVDQLAAPEGGRSHPHRGSCLPRAKPPVDQLEACQSAAGRRAVSHRRTQWTSRLVHPLRARATISYNSSRNHHYSKCQTSAHKRRIAASRRERLPTFFVHVVFALPHRLAPRYALDP